MERLQSLYYRKVEMTDLSFKRYLYQRINWDNRLIIINGAKGVGKTTLMLQHIKEAFKDRLQQALYVSLDHIWFLQHDLLELTEYFYTHGVTHLFLDEVHKLPNWQQQVKNIYDYYPDLFIVATGSSLLQLQKSITGDLSRRHKLYTLYGLSLREYMELEGIKGLPLLSLEEILENHGPISAQITNNIKILPHFERYLKEGYYPFYKEVGESFSEKVCRAVDNTIEVDIPCVSNIDYESVYKIKQLLAILSSEKPFTLNLSTLSEVLQSTRATVLKLLDLLDKGAIIRKLYASESGLNSMKKPEKILFDNSNLIFSLSDGNIGTARESCFASLLSTDHHCLMPTQGDFLVDKKYLFEVGGKNKGFAQIRNIESSFVVRDGIEIGSTNKIPLWLFGLLY